MAVIRPALARAAPREPRITCARGALERVCTKEGIFDFLKSVILSLILYFLRLWDRKVVK